MNTLIIKLGVALRPLLNLVYSRYKRRPTKNRVAFFTRQSNSPTLDFKLLIAELKRRSPDTEVVCVCKKLSPGILGAAGYLPTFFRQMNALGTSRVAVIDGYIPVVSYLDQREELYVLQAWHALGAFKKFSYYALDTEGGRSAELAYAFRMHENYSAVLCGGDGSRHIFSRAFNVDPGKVLTMPLPRYDELILAAQSTPAMNASVLYAPTFRDTDTEINFAGIRKLARACKNQGLALILKLHPLVEDRLSDDEAKLMGCTLAPRVSVKELMSMVGHVVTDYSAIAFEAAVAEKPVWYYIFDSEEYADLRGLALDPRQIAPHQSFSDAEVLAAHMKADGSISRDQKHFRETFVATPKTTATGDIVDLLLQKISKEA